MQLVYKYRAYPDVKTAAILRRVMQLLRHLYNDALQERRGAYAVGKRINFKDQMHQLSGYKKLDKEYAAMHPDWTEEIITRLDNGYQMFFKALKKSDGRVVGLPSFSRFNAVIKYIRSRSFAVNGDVLVGKKLPPIKFVRHRELPNKPTSCFIKEEKGKWFVGFVVAVNEAATCTAPAVGIDVGLRHLITDSDGKVYDLDIRSGLVCKLKRYQRKLAKQKQGSRRRKITVALITKLHSRIARSKESYIHTFTSRLSNNHIVAEDLNLMGLTRSMLSAQFHQNPIGRVFSQLEYKTKLKGRLYETVRAAGTSQTCLCGAAVPKTLSQRIHRCFACGSVVPRDVMSAMVIRSRSSFVSGLFTVPQALKTATTKVALSAYPATG